MYRVEDKFICSERDFLLLESRLKVTMSSDLHSRDSSYRITSLYFDDIEESHLKDSEDGNCFRNKYRMRIYNGSLSTIKLEVKYKAYNRVLKKSKTITIENAKKLISGACMEDDDFAVENPVTLFNLAIKNDFLRPKIVVDYKRNAYVSTVGNVRITFDRDIQSSTDVEGFLEGACQYTMLDDVNKILEIKYDELLPRYIRDLLETGNMIQTSYSKYRLCREQMGGYKCL